jgi:hypothetical protein
MNEFVQHRLQIVRFIKESLEYGIQEFHTGFELIGFEYNSCITGYFINPVDLTYIHVWKVNIDPEKRIIYSDTWEEKMLAPMETYSFNYDFIPTDKYFELLTKNLVNHFSFLRLEDGKDRFLRTIKERLKKYEDVVVKIAHPELYTKEAVNTVCRIYLQTLRDLENYLNDRE